MNQTTGDMATATVLGLTTASEGFVSPRHPETNDLQALTDIIYRVADHPGVPMDGTVAVVKAWPKPPNAVRAGIVAMVQTTVTDRANDT